MFLAVILIIILMIVIMLRRDFSNAENIRIKMPWIFPTALAIQLVIFNQSPIGVILEPYRAALHIFTYFMLILGVSINLSTAGFKFLMAGVSSNLIAIATHHGYMPATLAAVQGVSNRKTFSDGSLVWNNSIILSSRNSIFDWFGDIFHLPAWFPAANVFSLGDILIASGMVVFVWMISGRAKAV